MSAESTPGWAYDAALGLVCEGENVVAVVRGSDPDMADAEQDRRGRLIAAAPDMLDLVRQAESIFQNCSVTTGVCCCGDPMEPHTSPLLCGHTARDQGEYMASLWLESARAAISKAEGK